MYAYAQISVYMIAATQKIETVIQLMMGSTIITVLKYEFFESSVVLTT
jgi:hypothetical protein